MSIKKYSKITFILFILAFLYSCEKTEQEPSLLLTPSTFDTLPGWGDDKLLSFSQAFIRSCSRIELRSPREAFSSIKEAGTNGQWQFICSQIKSIDSSDTGDLKTFFETYFQPFQLGNNKETTGLFTGYFETSLNGSRTPKDPYLTPLHQRPDDLILVQLGDFRPELKGQRIAGRVINGKLNPYERRDQIIDNQWPHQDKVLVWVDDPVDAFFTHIQGSGLVRLDDGSLMRIGYAGHNGHPYYAIGRELIKMGELTKETVSMQSIRQWLEQHPDQANDIMNTNQSYIFFREIPGEGPIGAAGVALTAERSLAVDPNWIPYGLPLWVDIEPVSKNNKPIRRLLISQDTGGAIRGPVRGDLFWGHGKQAAFNAGQMKSEGRYWALFPSKNANGPSVDTLAKSN